MSDFVPAWTKESALLRLGEAIGLPPGIDPADAGDAGDGTGVSVAVIDSGIDASHPELHGCVDAAAGAIVDMAGEVPVARRETHDDVFGHGTACAGIIHGLAPAARIVSVRVLDEELSGRVAAFHAGLEWALNEGFDVINLSLGCRKREWALAFHELCDRAYFEGRVLVTAASNARRPSYPSLYSSAFSVACTTTTNPERYHVNPEPPTEFLARGIDVPVLWTGGSRSTGTGNSYAAPHIAGFAARILGRWPGLRPFHVKALLWAAAANIREATEPVVAGRITRLTGRRTLANRRPNRTVLA